MIMTDNLHIRRLSRDDASDMFEYTSNPEASKYLLWTPHISVEQDKQFINKVLCENDEKVKYFAIALKDYYTTEGSQEKLIGCIRVYDIDTRNKSCEISYIINPVYSKRGYGSEAVSAVIRWLITEGGMYRIQALCVEDNVGSELVMKKCNMLYEGTLKSRVILKDGKRHSMKLYAFVKEDL